MGSEAAVALLALHGVRVMGFADSEAVGARYGLDAVEVEESLLDDEAWGFVTRSSFGGLGGADGLVGWSLTERGRVEDERRVGAELDAAGLRSVAEGVLAAFEPLNDELVALSTAWQVRPVAGDPLAANRHDDLEWDGRVVDGLAVVAEGLARALLPLSSRLGRFSGYVGRYRAALVRVVAGESAYVCGVEVPSCHRVWMELHEDLLATLGRRRGIRA